MIPRAYTIEWQQYAPWTQEVQVEQDLIISRALVELFRCPAAADALAFRGGTALYKLFVRPPLRYSEDIDLVQLRAAPIGEVLRAIRGALDPWLGEPVRKRTQGRVALVYRMMSEPPLALPLRLKIEINTREHFSVFGISKCDFAVDSRWFRGSAKIPSYRLDELLGTKLRALYQRKKGRDLFDLAIALQHQNVNPERVVTAFQEYCATNKSRSRVQNSNKISARNSTMRAFAMTSHRCSTPIPTGIPTPLRHSFKSNSSHDCPAIRQSEHTSFPVPPKTGRGPITKTLSARIANSRGLIFCEGHRRRTKAPDQGYSSILIPTSG